MFSQGFIVTPNSLTVVEGETANYECQHHSADSIGWRINQSYQLPMSTSGRTVSSPNGGIIYILTIEAISEYNTTRIECVAYLYIQGDNYTT